MAESGEDKGILVEAQDLSSRSAFVEEFGGGSETAEDARKALQKALDDALIATGLSVLTLPSGDGGCAANSSYPRPSRSAVDIDSGGAVGESNRCMQEKEEEVPSVEREEEEEMVEWKNITQPFIQAASLLEPGELVKDWSFNLLDAMSAVELLDPKMDISMQHKNFRGYPRSVSEAISRGLLQLKGHTHVQLIGIFDEVLACLATWLNGYTLAQTVFSCLYLLEMGRPESQLLRSFAMGVIKTVDYMREFICKGGVYSEDDQQGVCFGFDMLTSISDTTVTASLRDSEERASTAVRQSVQADRQRKGERGGGGGGGGGDGEGRRGERTVSSKTEAIRAIVVRIRFIKNLFSFMSVLRKRPVSTEQTILSHLHQCLSLLSDIASSCPLGEKLDPEDPLKLGFHPLINQNLLPPSYRHCEVMPRENGISSLQMTLTQIETALSFGKLDSFRVLKRSIREFTSQLSIPNVLARSVVVLVSVPSDRTKIFSSPSLEEMLKKDTTEFSNPPSLNPRSPLYTSSQCQELTERFFARAVHPVSELLRLYCQPRARQQEKTERVLDYLADLQHETQRIDLLQNEVAMKVDPARQHLACYASWVLYHILHLMIDYVVLGFEYDLYSPFEMHYVYWYLEYLYGWLHTSWKTADKLTGDQFVGVGGGGGGGAGGGSGGGGGKGSKKKGKKLRKEMIERKEREVTVIHVKRMVCVGLMRAFEALIIEGKVHMPQFLHGSQELCFQHRFSAFACVLTPLLLSYADYQQLAGLHNYQGKDINLYTAASRHFASAKALLESLSHPSEELQGLLKAIKTNIVIMNLSAKGHKQDSKVKPTLDYSFHPHFPVIRIQ